MIDTHAHLSMGDFDADRGEVIQRARDNGVQAIIDVGCDLLLAQRSLALAQEYDFIYAAVGIHPHDAREVTEKDFTSLKVLAQKEKVVALGETGLDYLSRLVPSYIEGAKSRDHYENSPREAQKKVFRQHLKLAQELDLPIIIHCREAHEDCLAILKDEKGAKLRGVMHCFSGNLAQAKEYIDLGFYISFAGPVTFPKAQKTREIVVQLPLEKLLVETDCPYLAPVPYRGKRNEPAHLKFTIDKIAEVRNISVKELASITSQNAKNLFPIR